MAVALGSRVSPKLWASSIFWSHLTSSTNQDRYSVCLTPSSYRKINPVWPLSHVNRPRKFTILSEKFSNETPRLMKYSQIVRDISTKPGDWYFYNEQFRYIRQSAPDQYPWETIHWELWLKVVINFRARPEQPKPDMASPGTCPGQSFPKVTGWSFHTGKYCGGCKFEHTCFKCSAKHPSSKCSVVNQPAACRSPHDWSYTVGRSRP